MDLHSAIKNFVSDGRELYDRLHSDEGSSLTSAELITLKVQLYLLDHKVSKMIKEPPPNQTSWPH
jgi:hypothetical protein